jgi:ribosomal protein S17E
MGKIKGKLVKRTAKSLLNYGLEFNASFEENKRILGSTMPGKTLRNQIAGYLTRLKRNAQKQ